MCDGKANLYLKAFLATNDARGPEFTSEGECSSRISARCTFQEGERDRGEGEERETEGELERTHLSPVLNPRSLIQPFQGLVLEQKTHIHLTDGPVWSSGLDRCDGVNQRKVLGSLVNPGAGLRITAAYN